MFLRLEFSEGKHSRSGLSLASRWLLGGVISLLSLALMLAVISTDKATPGLAEWVSTHLDRSGVENPVTAVLLNFRSYDTLLEIAVLLIVALAILPGPNADAAPWLSVDERKPVSPLLAGLLCWLVPMALLVGGYLLWTGAYSPGGAFQAAAVIAGAGVALTVAGRHRFCWQSSAARLSLMVGLLMFMLVAAVSGLITGTTLQYPVAHAGWLILLIETLATVSIAAILLALFTQLHDMAAAPDKEGAP
ncbi:MAG: hypothetical protein AseanaTS_07330 [Candidatus Pelagadaptatus aseana]|uniref:hydrogen gas-evolving membrane-bound hydrogenase subunit E n=1 Tax=Candidatus Pelagadaptatus aseana TaxID=3120508 RepID=UPI0039B1EEDD